jgi:hypothetical protein
MRALPLVFLFVLLPSVALSLACGGSVNAAPDAQAGMDAGMDVFVYVPPDAGVLPDATEEPSVPVEAGPGPDAAFQEAPHTPILIPNNGGPVFASPTLVTITYADDPLRSFAEAIGAYLVQSPWLKAVGPEYGIGLGTHVPHELADDAPNTIADSDIQALIGSLIVAGKVPAPSGGPPVTSYDVDDAGMPTAGPPARLIPAIYMFYVPASTTETVAPGVTICDISGGGYHSMAAGTYGGQTFSYAVITACPNLPPDFVQQAVSHEFIEAATDPAATDPAYTIVQQSVSIDNQTSPWTLFGGEVGDLCSVVEPQWAEGGYTQLQRVYSNASAMKGGDPCLPANQPYFATDVEPQTFVGVPAGHTATFSLTGWSTAAVPSWDLGVSAVSNQPSTFMPSHALGASLFNDGEKTTLTVTVPPGTPSSSYAILAVTSAETQMDYSGSLVGVYVP